MLHITDKMDFESIENYWKIEYSGLPLYEEIISFGKKVSIQKYIDFGNYFKNLHLFYKITNKDIENTEDAIKQLDYLYNYFNNFKEYNDIKSGTKTALLSTIKNFKKVLEFLNLKDIKFDNLAILSTNMVEIFFSIHRAKSMKFSAYTYYCNLGIIDFYLNEHYSNDTLIEFKKKRKTTYSVGNFKTSPN